MAVPALIAVVEDEVTVRMAMELLLESLGYEIVGGEAAEPVMEALVARGRWPDLVVADYRLRHGRTGIEAVEAIRSAAGRSVPALIVTGDTSMSWQSQAAAAHLPVLQKPVSAQVLSAAVRRVVGLSEPGNG